MRKINTLGAPTSKFGYGRNGWNRTPLPALMGKSNAHACNSKG